MAAFSVKDLMSPMSKIEKTLEETNKTTKDILEVVTGISSAMSYFEVITTQLGNISNQLASLVKRKTAEKAIDKIKSKSEKNSSIKEGVELLGALGVSVKNFSQGLLIFTLVPKTVSKKLATAITDITSALEKTKDTKEALKNAQLLGDIGEALFVFTGMIALSTPAMIVGLVAIPMAVLEINMFLNLLSKQYSTKDTKNALENVALLCDVGIGLFAFFGYIALSAPLMVVDALLIPLAALEINMFVNLIAGRGRDKQLKEGIENSLKLGLVGVNLLEFMGTALLAGILAVPTMITLPAIWLTTWAITQIMSSAGKKAGHIAKGSLVLAAAGVALISLGISLLIFSVALIPFAKDPMKILIMGGVLATVGLIFAAAGVVAGPIALGALAMTAVAIPLILLSASLLLFSIAINVFGKGDKIEQMKQIITGVGMSFATVGAMAILVIPGALSMVAAGASLVVVSIGLLLYSLAVRNVRDQEQFANGLNAVVTGIGKSYAKAGLMSPVIIAGALAMIPAAIALIMLSAGLKVFKSIDWNPDEEKGDTAKLVSAFAGIRAAFLGTDPKNEKGIGGFFKKVGGVITGAVDAVRMVESAMAFIAAGHALILVSVGLKQMKKLDWTEKDTIALSQTLTTMSAAFEAVGKAGNVTKTTVRGGLLGRLFGGFSVDKNVVKEGIDSVMGAGKALKDISRGLVEFTQWYQANEKLIDMNDENSPFFIALRTTITSVGQAFAKVGNEGEQVEKHFLGFTWNKSAAAEGINSVKGAGQALKDIATGLVEFTKWYQANEKLIGFDPDNPNNETPFFSALKNTVTSVGNAFAAVGGGQTVSKGWFIFKWDKNAAAEGIDSVKGVEEALTGITNGLISFTAFYNNNKSALEGTTFDEAGIPNGGLMGMLYNVLKSTGDAFATIGGSRTTKKWGVFKWDKNAVAEGIKNVEGVQDAIQDVVNGTLLFVKSGIKTDDAKLLSNLLTSMGNGFGALSKINLKTQGKRFESFSERFKAGFDTIYKTKDAEKRMYNVNKVMFTLERQVRLDTFKKAADGIKKIAEAVNTIDIEKGKAFSDLFVAASKLKDNSRFYEDLKKAVEDIRNILAQNGMTGDSSTGANNNTTNTKNTSSQARSQQNNNTGNVASNLRTIQAGSITIETKGPVTVSGSVVNTT